MEQKLKKRRDTLQQEIKNKAATMEKQRKKKKRQWKHKCETPWKE